MSVRKASEPQPESGDVVVDVDIDAEHEWRMRMLSDLGFDHFPAFRLSVAGADWHECERLLTAGCSHELVLDLILD